jgi:cytochrome c oxidase subunit 3
MISVSLYRVLEGHFTPKHHFGFECAAWYWHFVDVVWLLLFLIFYVWGSFDRIEETYSVWNLFTGLQSN